MRKSSKKTNNEKEIISSWEIVYKNFDPSEEGLREALCTLGNGYMGTRGALCEARASRVHYPGTYIAGVYNTLKTKIAGRTISNEDLVNSPNWLPLTFKVGGGEWAGPDNIEILSYQQKLNMRVGKLTRKQRIKDTAGKITCVTEERIVHMASPHRAFIKYTILPENYEGKITVRSGLDGSVENTGVERYRELNSKHLCSFSCGGFGNNGITLSVRTSSSKIKISQASRLNIFAKKKKLVPRIITVKSKDRSSIYQEAEINVKRKKQYVVEKNVSTFTSKDKGVKNPLTRAVSDAKKSPGFDRSRGTHEKAWKTLWDKCDINVKGDVFTQSVLRLHIFHLLQSANIHNKNIDASIPARGLHGEAYRGHIFWDELFAMFFFTGSMPSVAKELLMYRYRRIKEARKYAAENGYKGSMFPWQSGSKGVEETQVIHLNPMSGKWGPDYSRAQRHVSFAIAYNVWKYWIYTGDAAFMKKYGAEILLSIAQFASSLAKYDKKDGRYHTYGLMGPDEFHERMPLSGKPGFKDNAYSNLLVVWTLMKSIKMLDILSVKEKAGLLKKLKITERELNRWKDITDKMGIVLKGGLISQFDGYLGLKELNWDAYRRKYGNIHRMDRILKAEGKSPNEYKVAKQADVLMLFYLLSLPEVEEIFDKLGYAFDKELLRTNYNYYIKRTSHGSTLSKVVHCFISHLLGKGKDSWRWFNDVIESDIYDTQGGTTQEGVHVGVMGGSIDITTRAFAGVEVMDDHIRISPRLPEEIKNVEFSFLYRGLTVRVRTGSGKVTLDIQKNKGTVGSKEVPVIVNGGMKRLKPGKKYRFNIKRSVSRPRKIEMEQIVSQKVLIVDGEITLSSVYGATLEKEGYHVTVIPDGVAALNYLKKTWVDAIVLSVSLKGEMDGYRFFKEIKKHKALKDIPIVMSTSHAGMKGLFKKLGVEHYLIKPYPAMRLVKSVKKVLSGKRYNGR